MATISELEKDIRNLTAGLNNPNITDAAIRQRLQTLLDNTQTQLAALQGAQQSTPPPPSTPPPTPRTRKPKTTPNISNIPSTDSSTWNAAYNVGDIVRVRVDFFTRNGYVQSAQNIYPSDNNVAEIINIERGGATPQNIVNGNNVGGFQRPENPSGLLYEIKFLRSGKVESWEGKDLEYAYVQSQPQSTIQQPIATTPTPQPMVSTPTPQGNSNFLNSMMSTVQAMMSSSSGSGADSPAIRQIIKDYLRDDKVNLSELDKSVLDEIKKNQLQVLEIPNFSMKIEVSSAVSKIPNFYEIIDDIFAGNNVYLIGEAGGGKTYTAEMIAKTLKREYVTLNCSQYTSPIEILGGQSVEGFKEGKLIDCWKNGKLLILDEMPKLDANTAGLFNDALAKSSKTRPNKDALINSANAQEPPIERHPNFAIIGTGNIYPNEKPAPQYSGNNRQDLSLLDRFSGSVYYTEFDKNTDENTTRFKFLYRFLVGNYYEYIAAKMSSQTLPTPFGLRTILEASDLKAYALVSYRTNIAFRVGFEYQLVREIAKRKSVDVNIIGKTLLSTFKSYLVAFRSNQSVVDKLLRDTQYYDAYVTNMVNDAINDILKDDDGFINSLNDSVRSMANSTFKRYSDFYVAQEVKVN
jgi:hypothetical protein